MADLYNEQSNTIIVNGKKMTKKEYKEFVASKRRTAPKKRKKADKTYIQELPLLIKDIVKSSGPIKSLSAYYDHGYRQWGTICRSIIQLPEIEPHFNSFRSHSKKINKTICEINQIGKKNDKSIFQFIQKLSWQLDDLQKVMLKLYQGISESGVIQRFSDREFINGTGRRLGLEILMRRTFESIGKMKMAINKLDKIANDYSEIY